MKALLTKLAELIFYKKKIFISLWLIILISSIFIITFSKNENVETELNGVENSEASQVKRTLEKEFNFKIGSSAAIVLENEINSEALINSLKTKFPEISKIREVQSNKQHKKQLVYLEFDPKYPNAQMQDLTPVIREYLSEWEKVNKVKTYFTGSTAFQYDSKASGKNDSKRGEIFALIISLIVLTLTFGGLLSALLPLFTGATTLIYMYGLIKFFGLSINPVSQILTGLVGLALAIDYSLFILSRFKEEIMSNDDKTAIRNTILSSGKTIFFSGLIMLCSISVLSFPDVSVTKVVVINMFLVILLSMLNSIVLLPPFLLLLKKQLDKPLFLSNFIKKSNSYSFWKKFSSHIVNYPKTYFSLSLCLLLGLSLPVFNIKLWSPVINIAPVNSESIKGYNVLADDGWGGELVPVLIIAHTGKSSIYSKEFISYIYDLTDNLKKNNSVENVTSITSWNKSYNKNDYFTFFNTISLIDMLSLNNQINPLINKDKNITLISVFPKNLINLDDSFNIINSVNDYAAKNKEFKIQVGGSVARVNNFTIELYNYIPQMLIIIFGGIYLLLLWHMKSVILPVKAAIMNFLPILSSFGILTIIFQYGYFHSLLNTPYNHAVTNIVPIVLFCVIFGLSMDYEVLILSRISEIYYQTKDVNKAIIEGTAKSSSLITGAALILIGVFVPGIFSASPQIKEICIGMTSAIFIDATIVRLLLVPSFMKLMGEWNWYNPFRK